MDNYSDKCITNIQNILKSMDLLDMFEENEELYIGGSLGACVLSQTIKDYNKRYDSDDDEEEEEDEDKNEDDDDKYKNYIVELNYQDIDIYTTNSVKTMNLLYKKYKHIVKEGVNLNVRHRFANNKNIKLQFILAEIDNFKDDVLSSYDTDMVKIGYHPATKKIIIHEDFVTAFIKQTFTIVNERTTAERVFKIKHRAKSWFGNNFKVSEISVGDDHFDKYSYQDTEILSDNYTLGLPPKYIQLFTKKYKCLVTKKNQSKLISDEGNTILINKFNKNIINVTPKTVTLLGGYNGLGNIINKALVYHKYPTHITSRSQTNSHKFELGVEIHQGLLKKMLDSEVIIMNAYSTLDGDESIWNTRLNTFSEDLTLQKIKINTFGYTKLLKSVIDKRVENIKNGNDHNIILVYMDASESKCENKLKDGKHLELNIAKAATKQVFYTNASLLASLGIFTVCFDPGWLSYHGVPVEKKESLSDKLIDPLTCSLGLMSYINSLDTDKLLKEKKFIHDVSFYDLI